MKVKRDNNFKGHFCLLSEFEMSSYCVFSVSIFILFYVPLSSVRIEHFSKFFPSL